MKEIGSRDSWQAVLNVPGALGGCGAFVSSLGSRYSFGGPAGKIDLGQNWQDFLGDLTECKVG